MTFSVGALGKGIVDSAGRKEQDDKIFHHDDWLRLGGLSPGNMTRGFKDEERRDTLRYIQNQGSATATTWNFVDDQYSTRAGPASLGRRSP